LNKPQIAKKYSKALISTYDTALIPGILEGLYTFQKLTGADKRLKLLFASRVFSDDEKNKALKILIQQIKATQETEKFLKLIILRGYLPAMKEIINASVSAYNEKLKKTTAVVISTVALEKNYTDRLKNALKNMTKREVDIDSQIDPSLLGGFIVKVGSTVYDSSLKGQFRLLRAELMR